MISPYTTFDNSSMKSRRRCSVQVGDGGHWVHQVADVDHEGQITTIQIVSICGPVPSE